MSINTCVICQEDTCTPTNPFLSPCSCKGTVSSIHRECLEQWVFHSNKTNCSVCHAKYRVIFADEIISVSKKTLLLQAVLYYLATITILTGIFYIFHPNTYQFEQKNILESILLYFLTTNIHFGIHMCYVVISLLFIVLLLGTIVSVYLMLTGDSSSYNHHLHDMNGISQILDSFNTTYTFKKPFISCFYGHTITFLIGGLFIYGIYSFLKWRNPPVKRLRIQI
ncbi:E3 ubiquitin-protein ligase MARCH [bacterium]|nr:E3 ubiquitin-protein ligase MARCH [bacterium]